MPIDAVTPIMSFVSFLFLVGFSTAIACTGSYGCKKEMTLTSVAGRFSHAEGLHWDHESQKLYCVDIEKQNACRVTPATSEKTCTFLKNGQCGYIIPVGDLPYRFMVGCGRDFILLVWNDKSNNTSPTTEILATVDADHPGNRWNDGKADSHGRFWGGTIGEEVNEVVTPNVASFYRIDSNLQPQKEISPVTNSNGLAWNLEDDTLYYIDTPTRKIASYDFDPITGTISNRRIAVDFAKHGIEGLPDGMTIDVDGNLWVAMYNNGTVRKMNPQTDELLQTIHVPALKVTTVTFGGPMLDVLYIATSSRGLSDKELEETPGAGYIFALENPGTRGILANSFHMHYSTPKPT